ncbi:23S rRNA pseudouridine synthase F [Salmonella enterica subsp. enterica]|uniref:23S rRNA pseudouridine synthase F n=1 Tax=Salmonella enterica I TaxID=59201 RepID=A0A379WGW1_SALET|nr:23S rRNA pseudouridine synthase F [Salmonella enterica subsp. enterica]
MLTDTSTRLNKYISESGICSRREADRLSNRAMFLSTANAPPLAIRWSPGMLLK